jgi:hypothetical protein
MAPALGHTYFASASTCSRRLEAADRDRDSARSKLEREGHSARMLVGLNTDEADEPAMRRLLDALDNALDRNRDVHLVDGIDFDRDLLAQHLPGGPIPGDRVEARQ